MKIKNIVITDVISDDGYSCLAYFARNGFEVWGIVPNINCKVKMPKRIEKNVHLFKMDMKNKRSIDKTINKIIQETKGQIDIFLNNSDHLIMGPIEEIPPAKVLDLFQTNYFGILHMLQKVALLFRKRQEGKIINVSTLSAQYSIPFFSHYASSKSALEHLSSSLRIELKPFNVQVCTVILGWIKDARKITKALSDDELTSVYSRYMFKMKSEVVKNIENVLPPEKVAEKIFRIADKKRMKPRYYLATFPQSFFLYFTRFITKSIEEEIILSYFKIIDKRKYRRISIQKDFLLYSGNNKFKIHLIDISRQGLKFNYFKEGIKIGKKIKINNKEFEITLLSNDMDNRIARIMFERIIPKGDFKRYIISLK
ncbi:MAG: SDR family NAD(P)-dependent oxidoreductase [Spirochaetes bacterium]|nr:SDR family NAD(P)-dependent oxidoreductase [Spirochaetota bacterium]